MKLYKDRYSKCVSVEELVEKVNEDIKASYNLANCDSRIAFIKRIHIEVMKEKGWIE